MFLLSSAYSPCPSSSNPFFRLLRASCSGDSKALYRMYPSTNSGDSASRI
jgi:hypothetical protein